MAAKTVEEAFNEAMGSLKDQKQREDIILVQSKFHDNRLEHASNTDYHIYPFLKNLCTKKIMDNSASVIQLSCQDERCSVCLLTFLTQQTSYGFIKAMRQLCSNSQANQTMIVPLREQLAQVMNYDLSDFQHFEIKCPRKTCLKCLTVEDLMKIIQLNV